MFGIRVSVLALPLAWQLACGARVSLDVDSLQGHLEAAQAQGEVAEEAFAVDSGVAEQEEQEADSLVPGMGFSHRRPQTRRRRSAEDERRKKEAHRRANLQDCVFSEQFGEWSACSATCGGGLRTRSLIARKIITPQDRFGYGQACPTNTRSFEACNHEILCSTDCSTVDLNNRLFGPGGVTKWEYEKESGECIFQLWQVIPGDSSSSATPRVRLLGETLPQVAGADAAVYDAASSEPELFALQAENADLAPSDVAVGFRNCAVRSQGDGAPSVAKVCLWGGEAFSPATQAVELDPEQQARLADLRRQSKAALGGELVKRAATKEGLGAGSRGVVFEGTGTVAGFAVRPTVAPQPPSAPVIGEFVEEGDDVKVKLVGPPRDNGAPLLPGFKVAARRLFGPRGGAPKQRACQFVPLPDCGGSTQEPCADTGLVLRNLPLASNYELQIVAENAAGAGQPGTAVVATRGKSGLPLRECWVDYWSCDVEGFAKSFFPSAGDPECSLSAPPLPVCRMEDREAKCDGKKYFVKCTPVMREGFPPVCAGEKEKICVNRVLKQEGQEPSKKCEARGCSKSWLFWNQKACCCQSATDTAEDSPSCACTKGKCKDLGLFEAADPARSCRH